MGHYSRAAQTCAQSGCTDVSSDADAIAELQRLHPIQDDPLPDLPEDAPLVIVAADDSFRKTVKKFVITGAAPSGSGWTGDHLAPLIDDADCLRVLALITTLIRNGELNNICRGYILGGVLFAIQKPAGGLRPIAPAEPFWKMAAGTGLATNTDAIATELGPYQLGLFATGGPETAGWLLRCLAAHNAVLAMDFGNAFNALERSAMLNRVYEVPGLATLWRMIHWAYSVNTPLWIRGPDGNITAEISSTGGCRQGDPLGPLLFAVAIRRAYATMLAVGGDEVRGAAILDDANIAGPPDKLLDCAEALLEGGNHLGLELRWAKCKLLWQHRPANELPDDIRTRFEELGIPIVFGTTKLLGVPIGSSEGIQESLMRDVDDQQPFFDSILHDAMPACVAERLLRLCGIPRMNYVSRTNYPEDSIQPLRAFDAKVQRTAQILRQDTYAPEAAPLQRSAISIRRDQQPFRHAGMSLRSLSAVADFAFLGALANSAPRLLEPLLGMGGFGAHFHSQLGASIACIRVMCGDDVEQLLPPANRLDPNTNMAFYATGAGRGLQHLQRDLSHSMERKAAAVTLQQCTPHQRATVVASGAPWANSFLALPLERMQSLPHDSAHATYTRLRLGDAPVTNLPPLCYCGQELTNDPWHFLCCNRLKATAMTYRHDLIVQTLADWIRRVGGTAQVEPRGLWAREDGGDGRRPDIRVLLGGLVFLLDAAVVHPTAASRIGTPTSLTELGAATQMETLKTRRYTQLARHEQATFVPFVVETFGGFGREARQFCTLLSRFAEGASEIYTRTDVLLGLRADIAHAIQRGNADIVRVGMQRSRRLRRRDRG
jgi:hypothetical protein